MSLALGVVLLLAAWPAACHAAINPRPELRVKQFFGIEEPASAAFSVMEAVVIACVAAGVLRARARHPLAWSAFPYHVSWFTFVVLFGTAFCSSISFHVHETWLNERMDYFSGCTAASLVAAASIVRILGLRGVWQWVLVYGPVIASDARFLWYQANRRRLDYGWAVQYGGAFLVGNLFLTIPWSAWRAFRRGDRHVLWELASGVSTAVFVTFEIVDFRPLLGVFDAHSLWHAAGVLIAGLHGKWLIEDFEAFAIALAAEGKEEKAIQDDQGVATPPKAQKKKKQSFVKTLFHRSGAKTSGPSGSPAGDSPAS